MISAHAEQCATDEAQLPEEMCHYAILLEMAAANTGYDKAPWRSSVVFSCRKTDSIAVPDRSQQVLHSVLLSGRVVLANMQDLADV